MNGTSRPNSADEDTRQATAAVQALSPWAEAEPSAYLRLQPGRSQTLDIAFTYTRVPAGQFTWAGPAEGSPNHVLHLNVRDDDYYQRGIPGVTGSVEQTALWLGLVRRELGATRIRTVGASMGGYAALLFGHLLDADATYAFSPVLKPGHLPLGRPTQFFDVSPLLRGLLARSVVTFGAFELSDYQYLLPCLQAGMRIDEAVFLADFHPGLLSLRLPALFAAPDGPRVADLVPAPHRSGLDAADVAMLAGLMDTLAQRDHAGACAVLGPLTRRDTENAGLLYRLGVHQALAGWPAAARLSMRHAGALLAAIGPATLVGDADLRRRSLRDYAHQLGFEPMRAIHAVIDAAECG